MACINLVPNLDLFNYNGLKNSRKEVDDVPQSVNV